MERRDQLRRCGTFIFADLIVLPILDVYRPKNSGPPINQGSLGRAKRSGAIRGRIRVDAGDPSQYRLKQLSNDS